MRREEGGGSRTQKFVYHKWPDKIFPTINFAFSHDGHFGPGAEGGGGSSDVQWCTAILIPTPPLFPPTPGPQTCRLAFSTTEAAVANLYRKPVSSCSRDAMVAQGGGRGASCSQTTDVAHDHRLTISRRPSTDVIQPPTGVISQRRRSGTRAA